MLNLQRWPLGVALSDSADPRARIYFRFYEWHLFDAVTPGDHTAGRDDWAWRVSPSGDEATIRTSWLNLDVRTVTDGAEMILSVANLTDHDWGPLAALIPCLGAEYEREGVPASPAFFDDDHRHTQYVGPDGLEPLQAREIHYAASLVSAVLDRSPKGDGAFASISHKWPHASRAAHAGLLLRESVDGDWVTGVAWERYLSAQGHNPRRCMHLSMRVGPLARGERRSIRAMIYLFRGNAEDCLTRYRQAFPC